MSSGDTVRNSLPYTSLMRRNTPSYRLMLGRRVVHTIAKAFTQPGHDPSYQNTIFAERAVGRHPGTLRLRIYPRRLHE